MLAEGQAEQKQGSEGRVRGPGEVGGQEWLCHVGT